MPSRAAEASAHSPASSTPPDATPAALALVDAVRATMRELGRIEHAAVPRALRVSSVHTSRLTLLRVVAQDPGITVAGVAQAIAKAPSTCSVLVAALVARGLLTSARVPSNRRRVVLHVTAAGQSVLRAAPASASLAALGRALAWDDEQQGGRDAMLALTAALIALTARLTADQSAQRQRAQLPPR